MGMTMCTRIRLSVAHAPHTFDKTWQITWKRSVHCCLGNGHDGKYTHSRPVKYACANEFDMPSPLPCIAPLATEKKKQIIRKPFVHCCLGSMDWHECLSPLPEPH